MVIEINLYDLIFLGTIFIGTTFSFLLLFAKRINGWANLFLGLAVMTIVLWMVWVFAIDIKLDKYCPHWDWLPNSVYFYKINSFKAFKHSRFPIRCGCNLKPILIE